MDPGSYRSRSWTKKSIENLNHIPYHAVQDGLQPRIEPMQTNRLRLSGGCLEAVGWLRRSGLRLRLFEGLVEAV
ncbi:hypothetical protein L6452_05969 [Arctium lappa]|uniref:Uncharacterized protein n=1 Tax=Arctium lappa TaxID=4217 RepID=A0ACB9EHA3_ARCLA|nr:hypothetical protein L6452_05969 [Arctium lappa]